MRAVTFGLTVLAALIAAGLATIQAADTGPVTFAVLRGDGILIPIATRDGTKWTRSWPAPAKRADVPLALDGIPKRWWGKGGVPARWHAWQIDGTTREVAVERPAFYLAHCQQGVGLKTALTAQPPLPPQTVQPYPKLGLAATSPIAFQRIEPVDQGASIWAAAGTAMAKAVGTAEAQMGAQMLNNPRGTELHPFAEAVRAKTALRIDALYRMPLDATRSLYYVEAVKRYPMPPLPASQKRDVPAPRKDGCGVMTFAQGWFVSGVDGAVAKPPKLEDVRVIDCDYDAASLMLPLAYIADDATPIWIAQLTSPVHESYIVLRWDAAAQAAVVAFETPGGVCIDDEGE